MEINFIEISIKESLVATNIKRNSERKTSQTHKTGNEYFKRTQREMNARLRTHTQRERDERMYTHINPHILVVQVATHLNIIKLRKHWNKIKLYHLLCVITVNVYLFFRNYYFMAFLFNEWEKNGSNSEIVDILKENLKKWSSVSNDFFMIYYKKYLRLLLNMPKYPKMWWRKSCADKCFPNISLFKESILTNSNVIESFDLMMMIMILISVHVSKPGTI